MEYWRDDNFLVKFFSNPRLNAAACAIIAKIDFVAVVS